MGAGEGTLAQVLAGEARWGIGNAPSEWALGGFPDGCIDACACDPPYELGFMGKRWDASGIAFSVELWREVLRVLKPGAHLLAFGGTRTSHRMVCAIEDAGFEIRDCIGWVFASGFPKSLNVSAALDAERCRCNAGDRDVCELSETVQHPAREQSQAEALLAPVLGKDTGGAPDSDWRVGQGGLDSGDSGAREREDDRRAESGVEGGCDILPEARELRTDQVRTVPECIPSDGAQRRLRDGAQAFDGAMDRPTVDTDRGGSPCRPQSAKQHAGEPGAVARQSESQTRGAWPACRGCGKPIVPDGLGTALKPAWENITVARKPLSGTVAANVLEHGTGGINVDGCRIGGAYETRDRDISGGASMFGTGAGGGAFIPTEGRWPANVIHDGSPEVLEAFARYGDRPSGASVGDGGRIFGNGGGPTHDGYPGENGSAARFFFAAKASRAEREFGCEHLPARVTNEATPPGSAGANSPRAGAGRLGHVRNVHPTVKPLALMRYLCRLVTPPAGIVIDPFAGSGTTGMAALLEGFRFMGLELDPYHVRIARARINHVDGHGAPPEDEREEYQPAQRSLFG